MHLPQLLLECCSAANGRNTLFRKSVFCANRLRRHHPRARRPRTTISRLNLPDERSIQNDALSISRAPPARGIRGSSNVGRLETPWVGTFSPRGAPIRRHASHIQTDPAAPRTLPALLGRTAKRARVGELGIFPEDADIPIGVIARLWKGAGPYSIEPATEFGWRFNPATGSVSSQRDDVMRRMTYRTTCVCAESDRRFSTRRCRLRISVLSRAGGAVDRGVSFVRCPFLLRTSPVTASGSAIHQLAC